jgi:hypothetical protein
VRTRVALRERTVPRLRASRVMRLRACDPSLTFCDFLLEVSERVLTVAAKPLSESSSARVKRMTRRMSAELLFSITSLYPSPEITIAYKMQESCQ